MDLRLCTELVLPPHKDKLITEMDTRSPIGMQQANKRAASYEEHERQLVKCVRKPMSWKVPCSRSDQELKPPTDFAMWEQCTKLLKQLKKWIDIILISFESINVDGQIPTMLEKRIRAASSPGMWMVDMRLAQKSQCQMKQSRHWLSRKHSKK